jgi:hypothetical protein
LANFFTSDLFIFIVLIIFLSAITVKVVYDKIKKPGCASCNLLDFDREMEKIRAQIKESKEKQEN